MIEKYIQFVDVEKKEFGENPYGLPARDIKGYCQYGTYQVLSKYCGITKTPNFRKQCDWQHGWIPSIKNRDIELVVGLGGDAKKNKERWQYVARLDQEYYLKKNGFKNVQAIGLPIVYVKKPILKKKENAVLLVPCHGLNDGRPGFEMKEWLESCKHKIKGKEIFVLLHSDDYIYNRGVEEIRKFGYNIIVGACYHDMNSLNRIASIFSMFQNVLSNGYGSHLTYASYFGAVVSVVPPYCIDNRTECMKSVFYQNSPYLLDMIDYDHGEMVRKACPFFLDNSSIVYSEWACKELGVENKKTPEQIKQLFGWDLKGYFKNFIYRVIGKTGFLKQK